MSKPLGPVLRELLDQNIAWADAVDVQDPTFFERSAIRQDPKVLWIGCADSRVPESVILGCMPGSIFSHRNIANQVFADDPNAVSVITYAILELGVEYIVVCGHTRCGGVAVCLDHAVDKAECFQPLQTTSWPPPAPLDTWLAPLRELALSYPTPPSVLELVKANIQQQVMNLLKLPVVKNAWMGGKLKGVRGWIYELETGHASDLGINVVLGNSQELTCSR